MITMTYNKPEVVALGSALVAIQQQTSVKPNGSVSDQNTGYDPSELTNIFAYEGDE
jgi:hypothetical protein